MTQRGFKAITFAKHLAQCSSLSRRLNYDQILLHGNQSTFTLYSSLASRART